MRNRFLGGLMCVFIFFVAPAVKSEIMDEIFERSAQLYMSQTSLRYLPPAQQNDCLRIIKEQTVTYYVDQLGENEIRSLKRFFDEPAVARLRDQYLRNSTSNISGVEDVLNVVDKYPVVAKITTQGFQNGLKTLLERELAAYFAREPAPEPSPSPARRTVPKPPPAPPVSPIPVAPAPVIPAAPSAPVASPPAIEPMIEPAAVRPPPPPRTPLGMDRRSMQRNR